MMGRLLARLAGDGLLDRGNQVQSDEQEWRTQELSVRWWAREAAGSPLQTKKRVGTQQLH